MLTASRPSRGEESIWEAQLIEREALAKAEQRKSVCTKGPRFTNVQYIPYTDRQRFTCSCEPADHMQWLNGRLFSRAIATRGDYICQMPRSVTFVDLSFLISFTFLLPDVYNTQRYIRFTTPSKTSLPGKPNMEVMEGVSVRLYTGSGKQIELLQWNEDLEDLHVNDDLASMKLFRTGYSVKPGTVFYIAIEISTKFRLYSAAGLKFTTAIGHTRQEPGVLHDVQAQFIGLQLHNKNSHSLVKQIKTMESWRYIGRPSTTHRLRTPVYERKVFPLSKHLANFRSCWQSRMLITSLATDAESGEGDKLVAAYNAPLGHITLFVTRGSLFNYTDKRRPRYRTDPPGHVP